MDWAPRLVVPGDSRDPEILALLHDLLLGSPNYIFRVLPNLLATAAPMAPSETTAEQ
jgi:hypothetical protein